jgi:hypothetical protein
MHGARRRANARARPWPCPVQRCPGTIGVVIFPAQAELLPCDSSVTFASWLNLLLIGSCNAETDASFDLCERNIATVLRKHPRGVGLMLIVTHSQRAPDNYADRVLGLLRRFRPQVVCTAVVVEMRGFAGAAHRALGHSVISLSGMRSVISLFDESAKASDFLGERLFPIEQRSAGTTAMAAAIGRFRASLRTEEVVALERSASR